MQGNKTLFILLFIGAFLFGTFMNYEKGVKQEIKAVKDKEFDKFINVHKDAKWRDLITLRYIVDKDFFVKKVGKEIHLCSIPKRIHSVPAKRVKTGLVLRVYTGEHINYVSIQ